MHTSYGSGCIRIAFLAALALASVIATPAVAQAVDLFELPGDEVRMAVVTSSAGKPARDLVDSNRPEMVLRLREILAVIEGRELSLLFKCAPRARESIDLPANAVRVFYLHLYGQNMLKSVAIYRTDDGKWIGEEEVGMLTVLPNRARLDPSRFSELAKDWPLFGGPFDANELPIQRGVSVRLEPPYTPGRLHMDDRTLRSRTFVAQPGEAVGTTRVLAEETLHARLPADYDPHKPAGLLVWVHAMQNGAPPAVFNRALDELNIICIGADNIGNDRPVADRYQLALDATATASARFHVDLRRVYVSGISGGGRISSMLWATAPETFTGAIPIVGINYFKAIPTGDGRKWPATYKRPPGDLLRLMKEHRVAAMTGPPDFNYASTAATIELMQRDGFEAKLFEYPDMAHEMPTSEQFLEALRWVDAPYRNTRAKDLEGARRLLDQYLERFGPAAPTGDAAREELYRVIRAAAFSDPAWEAVRLLGMSE